MNDESPEFDDEAINTTGTNYASDRHLLLHEIKTLAGEVARLRGDTKYLNEVMVPREEVRRRRRVNFVLVGLMLLLFSIAMGGLYIQSEQISRTQQAQAQQAYEKCLSDEAAARRGAKGFVEINALLSDLRNAQTALAGREDATRAGRETATKQALSYNRYLSFVREMSTERSSTPLKDCSALKP